MCGKYQHLENQTELSRFDVVFLYSLNNICLRNIFTWERTCNLFCSMEVLYLCELIINNLCLTATSFKTTMNKLLFHCMVCRCWTHKGAKTGWLDITIIYRVRTVLWLSQEGALQLATCLYCHFITINSGLEQVTVGCGKAVNMWIP